MVADAKDEQIRALREEVRRLQLMLESAPDFITRITVDGAFLYLNHLAPGFTMAEVLGTSVDAYVPAEFRARAREAMRMACETRSVQQYATIGQISANKMGHYLTRVSPIVEHDQVTSLVMTATDVTALEESRTLLQVALNATGLGIWTYEPGSGTGTWDATTRRIFGVDGNAQAPDLDTLLKCWVHPDDGQLVADSLARALETGRYGPLEHRILLPSGELRFVSGSGVALKNPQGEVVQIVGSVMDITQRRVLEARLLEAQKLESIGRLAGGVAHDFNNMLTAILGNVDFACQLDSMAEARPLLDEIRVTAERSAALTAQLLAFARRQLIEPKVLAPNKLLQRIEPLLRRLLGERSSLRLALGSQGQVRVDASQLEQVVLNLITNARDWMPDGGPVTLETHDITLSPDEATRYPDLAAGSYVVITVSDSGPGIPERELPQIFEPFFTTRRGGTGLGLATCYGIVKQSGGHIAVHNQPGSGAVFSVYLPKVEAAATEPAAVATPEPQVARNARVLLVEDEALVRGTIARTLERGGFIVTVAADAEEALHIAASAAPFDLLITDIVMPGLGGWEVGKRLTERWPALKVLYISGYTDDAEGDGRLGRDLPFLQKPFLPGDLLATVNRLLAAQR